MSNLSKLEDNTASITEHNKVPLNDDGTVYYATLTNCVDLYLIVDTKPAEANKAKDTDFNLRVKLGKYKGARKTTYSAKTNATYLLFELDNKQFLIPQTAIISIEAEGATTPANSATGPTTGTVPTALVSTGATPLVSTGTTPVVAQNAAPVDLSAFEKSVTELNKAVNSLETAVKIVIQFHTNNYVSNDEEIEITQDKSSPLVDVIKLVSINTDEKNITTIKAYLKAKKEAVDTALQKAKKELSGIDTNSLNTTDKKRFDDLNVTLTDDESKISLTKKLAIDNPLLKLDLDTIQGGGKRRTARKAGASKRRLSKKDKKTRKVKRAGRKA